MTDHAILEDKVVSLGDVDVTATIAARSSRASDFEAESRSMAKLVEILANRPEELPQALAEAAMALTGADSAGVTLERDRQPGIIFEWIATAGEFARYAKGTMPRNFSPCGSVVAKNQAIVMREPVKVFPYIESLHAPVREVLLLPFHREGRPVGTVWVVNHDDRTFDAEDLRIVGVLTSFAGAAMQSVAHANHLQELDRNKDNFLAMLAHEIRNPLGSIGLAAKVLSLAQGEVSAQQKTIAIIQKQTKQLASLVEDITDVVSIRSGKLKLQTERTTAQDILSMALEVSAPVVEAKGLSLQVFAPPDPLVLEVDPPRLAQVLINLINNATKYTESGGHIQVTAASDAGGVVFEVVDTGKGISAEMLNRVFDMFMQVNTNHSPDYCGLGIGLALVRQIVELHGGVVGVSSPGLQQGSTFTVRLPKSL
jgi:signal transduction histidine kinase